jgi:RNA polymerase sigma-70 factor (ECF subfamily)
MRTSGARRISLQSERHGPMTSRSEIADAAAAADGDTRAFERLYEAHVARIHSLVRRMLDADVVDDVTQDVFIRAWNKLGSFRGEAAFGTWLHRLAINVILARRKQLGRQRERFAAGDEAVDRRAAVRETPGLAMDFEAAIGRLPPRAKEVFVLHDVEGYKHHEIAEMLKISDGTSKSQLHRARMFLRRYLDG